MQVLGIAGCQLIFPAVHPAVTPSSIVTHAELQEAIARRTGVSFEAMVEGEPFLGAARDPDAQTRSVGTTTRFQGWQMLPSLIFADVLMSHFEIRRIRLVTGSLTQALLQDEPRWVEVPRGKL